MLSYKEFKQFNEFSMNTGVKSVSSLGVLGSQTPQTKTVEELLDEAKEKCKKMFAGTDQRLGLKDGEMVSPSAVKDDPENEVEDEEETSEEDEDEDNEDCKTDKTSFTKFFKKKSKESKKNEVSEEFFSRIRSQMQPRKPHKDLDVNVKEEILFPNNDPNSSLVSQDASEPVKVYSSMPDQLGYTPLESMCNDNGDFDIRKYMEHVNSKKK